MTWLQIKMVSVSQNDLSPHFFKVSLRCGLHRTSRSYRHKNGCFNFTMSSFNNSGSGLPRLRCFLKKHNQSFPFLKNSSSFCPSINFEEQASRHRRKRICNLTEQLLYRALKFSPAQLMNLQASIELIQVDESL